jgi:hypothetical protein
MPSSCPPAMTRTESPLTYGEIARRFRRSRQGSKPRRPRPAQTVTRPSHQRRRGAQQRNRGDRSRQRTPPGSTRLSRLSRLARFARVSRLALSPPMFATPWRDVSAECERRDRGDLDDETSAFNGSTPETRRPPNYWGRKSRKRGMAMPDRLHDDNASWIMPGQRLSDRRRSQRFDRRLDARDGRRTELLVLPENHRGACHRTSAPSGNSRSSSTNPPANTSAHGVHRAKRAIRGHRASAITQNPIRPSRRGGVGGHAAARTRTPPACTTATSS